MYCEKLRGTTSEKLCIGRSVRQERSGSGKRPKYATCHSCGHAEALRASNPELTSKLRRRKVAKQVFSNLPKWAYAQRADEMWSWMQLEAEQMGNGWRGR